MEAALSRVEVSRVSFDDTNDGKTVVSIMEINDDYKLTDGSDFFLKPFDIITVRRAPEFELQRNITLKGEVRYQGSYSITKENEKISDVIKRAGGLSEEAFAAGATLYRVKDGVGYVVMALDEVIRNNTSKHNYILKDGDIIEIPKKKDFVSIRGASKAKEIYPDKILKTGQINVPYHKGKTAKWHVDHFAAGVGEDGRRRLITVEHPNGRIEKTNDYGLFKKYPKVEKGSVITVGKVEDKTLIKDEERKDVDWGRVFADAITQATSILALILLIESAN
jgi:Periplasmic protein involved in polysaccharide export